MEGNAVVIDTGAQGVLLFIKCFIKIIGCLIKWIYRIVSLNKGTGDTDYVEEEKE